jgi:calcineurin-like phosphoesterase family protein
MIAFIGDQGLGPNAQAVLTMIRDEGADAIVHSGDFDYADNPQAWDAQIDAIFGANFPYFGSIGNHDETKFYGSGGYQEILAARMHRLGIAWSGDLGVQSNFVFQGMHFVQVGPGVVGTGHDTYIHDVFASSRYSWRIASWHKDMHLMQPEGKADETGWGVYEQARKAGAFIATAHAHDYCRTHLLSSMQNQVIASTSNTLVIAQDDPSTPQDEGRSFAFVSGLGGESIRAQQVSGPWFASIYTSTQSAEYGALFGVFNPFGDPTLARFYFKNIDGVIIDAFQVRCTVIPNTTDTVRGSSLLSLQALLRARGGLAVQFQLREPAPVSLRVLDVRGRLVHEAFQNLPYAAGAHRWEWDGAGLASGVYVLELHTPHDARTARAVVLR